MDGRIDGRAKSPLNIQAQVEGGVAMGLGYALMEHLETPGGIPPSRLAPYRAPRCGQVLPIATVIVEDGGGEGPYGAKGLSASSPIPVAAVFANAVYDAIGVRVTELPITSSALRALLHQSSVKVGRT